MKHILQGKKILTLSLLFRLIFSGAAYGSHTMGADLTYKSMGGNMYKITVSFYRDCIGIPAPANPFVTINSSSCGQSMGVTCYPRSGTGKEVTPSCSSSVTTCNGGSFTGIQEWIYDGIVTLPAQCTDWVFGYSLCCRNAAITTITNPSTNTFYIYATLNNTITPQNSSPTFSNKPVPFLCLGQQFCFNHGAYDVDGDSLAYTLITPKQTASTTVNYIAPYNASNPLNSAPVTSFNPSTGDICLTPQALEVTVMAVVVQEFRNGVLIGSVERDLQLTVMNCLNNLPSLTGINGTNIFSMTICANQQTCFDIFSNDPDNGQQLTVDWNYGIAGGTFNGSSAAHPVGTFCWTPSSSDIGHSYSFTATVTDDACPYNGSQTYSYNINVIGMYVNAGLDQAIACSDLATLTANASGGSGTYTYLWSNGSTMQSITVGAGTYIITANDGNCSATDTVNVTTPFIPVAAFTNTPPGCINSPISFTDQSTTSGGVINYWYWSFGDGDTSSLQNPIHLFPGPGTYNVTLIIENTLGCRDTVTMPIIILTPPVAEFTWGTTCVNSSVSFTDQTTSSPTSWNWLFGDGTFSNQQNPSHIYSSSGNYTVTLITGNIDGCIDTVSHVITIYPLPVANAGANQTTCAGSPVTLTASGGLTYTWSPGGQTGQVIIITPSGSSTIIVTVTDTNGCSSTDTVNIIVNPLPIVNAGADQSICNGTSVTLTASGALTYSWTPGGSTASSITVFPSATTSYTVTGTDGNGCSSTDVVKINILPLPIANAGPDADICNASNITLTATGGVSYLWSPGGGTNQSITVNPSSSQTYLVTVTNANGCSATDAVKVNVHPKPTINLQSFFLCAGSNATLDAGNPGSTFLWNTGDTTQTIQISSGGIYSVTVTDNYGCSASASCNVSYGSTITINLGNVFFCQGDSVLLDAGYSGMNYTWTPGGQTTQTIYINSAGTYGVSVTDNAGCSGSINITAIVNPLPVADFSSLPACNGNPMSFSDGSSIISGSINGWSWNFGDGTTSMIQNPVHSFPSSGNYSVILTATSGSGCTSSITHNATVNPLPVADFSFSNNCLGSPVIFSDQSNVSSGNIISYSWDFGDSSTSTIQNPLHTYSASGNYSVNLQVTTAGGCSQTVNHTVTIHPSPIASFSTSPVCQGNTTLFTNTSNIATGSITSFSWDFNDTYTSTQSSPSHIFTSPGTYAVKLIVSSSFGCTDTIINNVQVNALPVANAGANQVICSGNSTTLTANGGNTYTWNPGAISGQSITISPSISTTYTVTVTDVNGCTSTDAAGVFVSPLPNAQAGNNQSLCSGNSITLNGTGGVTYNWSPGGMTTSVVTVQPFSTVDYILTVTDANGCVDMDTITITVNNLPTISAGPDNSICSGSTTSLTASGAASYQWNPIGMSTATVLVTPTSTTTYTVIGTNANGCTSSDVIKVTVNPVPVINLLPAFICAGFSTILDAGNPGSIYNWSTGENTQTISVSDSGTYSVIVTSPNGCPAMSSTVVTKGGGLTASPSNYSICSGQNASLNAGNPGSSYQWSTGQTSQVITVNTAGNYFVTITDINGCVATLQHILKINPLPSAAFIISPVCQGTAMMFNDNSTVSTGTIQSVLWDFGDGNSSSSFNTSHLFSTAGNYPVSLTVTTMAGCTSAVTHQAQINPLPVADFSSNPACQNKVVTFNNLSAISSGNINVWDWSFGDGTSSSSKIPTHFYSPAGNYVATLIARSNLGCTDTISKSVTVLGLPDASFTSSNTCAQSNINFVNNSSTTGSPITSYIWNLGNGNTSSAFQPSVQYASSGTYNVKLIVTASNGCADTAASAITIYPLPLANFTATPSCIGAPVTMNNNSTIPNGVIQSYYWTFGDNSSSTVGQPTHSYNSDGSFTIKMIATTNMGCRDTITKIITIYPVPVPSFSGQDVCFGNDIQFLNNSSINTGTITSWQWNFNDGTSSTQNAPSHIYNSPGSYNVNLTATSNFGCQANANLSANVFPNPVAAFTTANVCYGSNTQLVNQSTIHGGGNLYNNWIYSDGDSSSSYNPMHTFPAAGNYNVKLMVTSSNGCIDQVSQNLDVYHLPMARFAAPNNCSGTPIPFSNQSTSQDGNITAFLWGFGDGNFSFDENPVHQYSDTGAFNVDLITISSLGCAGNYSDTLSIFSHPSVAIQMNNSCVGAPIQFNSTSNQSGGVSYSWSLGNVYTTTAPSFNYAFNAPGTYTVSLVATSASGCSGTKTDQLNVYPNPVAAFSGSEVCLSSQTIFNNQSIISTGTVSSYTWNFGDNQQSVQNNPSHTYSSPGVFNAILTATSNHGCLANITRQVIVHPNPTVNFSAGMQGCRPVNAGFSENTSISSGTVAGRLWNFGDGEISTDTNPHHIYDQSGTYDVTLTVVSDFGCMASVVQPNIIRVFPNPLADFIADPMITDILMPVVHFQNQSQNYTTYQWVFGDGTFTNTDFNPTHTFRDTGTYSAMLITVNNFGCRDTILKTIEVRLHSTLFIANCFTPNGDGNNDVFRPFHTNMEEIQVWVYDRWGKLLTSWNGLDGSWDGYYQGRKCQSDTYVYKIIGTGIDGKHSEWVGHVSIVY